VESACLGYGLQERGLELAMLALQHRKIVLCCAILHQALPTMSPGCSDSIVARDVSTFRFVPVSDTRLGRFDFYSRNGDTWGSGVENRFWGVIFCIIGVDNLKILLNP